MEDYNFERFNVLIADGNRNTRMLLATVLREFGIDNIEFAGDGREALEMLVALHPDMVLCEYRMTPMDGIEMARRIRALERTRDRFVPILMVTGHTEPKVVTAARDAGVTDFLAKPISAAILLQRIVNLIEDPRPFVDALPDYFGPDRRSKRRESDPNTPRRRVTDKEKNPV
jgi:CheY-like chemotaxis protein